MAYSHLFFDRYFQHSSLNLFNLINRRIRLSKKYVITYVNNPIEKLTHWVGHRTGQHHIALFAHNWRISVQHNSLVYNWVLTKCIFVRFRRPAFRTKFRPPYMHNRLGARLLGGKSAWPKFGHIYYADKRLAARNATMSCVILFFSNALCARCSYSADRIWYVSTGNRKPAKLCHEKYETIYMQTCRTLDNTHTSSVTA